MREVPLTPRKDWGGNGLLGCDVSFGFFNKIPLREKDKERINAKNSMKGIFGKLTGEKVTHIGGAGKQVDSGVNDKADKNREKSSESILIKNVLDK